MNKLNEKVNIDEQNKKGLSIKNDLCYDGGECKSDFRD
jgi:hypothetical protein